MQLDGGTFDHNGSISGAKHMREQPADGHARFSNNNDGGIYRFAGGAPLWISSCSYWPQVVRRRSMINGQTMGARSTTTVRSRAPSGCASNPRTAL